MASSSSSSTTTTTTTTDVLEGLEYTTTLVVAVVCTVIVVISLFVERFLHYLGKFLKTKNQESLFEALQRVKEANCRPRKVRKQKACGKLKVNRKPTTNLPCVDMNKTKKARACQTKEYTFIPANAFYKHLVLSA